MTPHPLRLESAQPPRETQAIRTLGINPPRLFRCALWLLPCAVLAFSLPGTASAEFYRWTDDQGITRYTSNLDRVPRRHRDSAQLLNQDRLPFGGTRPDSEGERAAPRSLQEFAVDPPADGDLPETRQPPAPVRSEAPPPTEPAVVDLGEPPSPDLAAPDPPAVSPQTPSQPPASSPGGLQEPSPAGSGETAEPEPDQAHAPLADPRTAEAAELRSEIAAKREQIKQLIGESRWQETGFADDPRLQELAEDLPRLQAELQALNAEPER